MTSRTVEMEISRSRSRSRFHRGLLRSRLWMAVGLRGAWERSNGGDGEEKAVGPCSYAVEDLSEKSTSVDRTVEEEEEENERCEKKSMDR
uniref:Uncharacterized protein n=1 Tax=Fagus sylvatica TaxID=28930 RepID=A0A2N9ESK6_FAGSY